MVLKDFMESNRLEAFFDAIIAIIVTVLVLELPQPKAATLSAIWDVRISYFAYFLSFLVCVNLWQYHHKIFRHVEKINNRIIWLNILLMLIISIIPYLTLFVSDNFNSFLAQALYGLNYILVAIVLAIIAHGLMKINSHKEYLKDVRDTLGIPFILFIIAFIIGFYWYPQAISIICLFTVIRSLILDIK